MTYSSFLAMQHLKRTVRDFLIFHLETILKKVKHDHYKDKMPDRKMPRLLPEFLFRRIINVHFRIIRPDLKIGCLHKYSPCKLSNCTVDVIKRFLWPSFLSGDARHPENASEFARRFC